MNAFIAMIWDPRNAQTGRQIEAWSTSLLSSAQGWRVSIDAGGLRVFTKSNPIRHPLELPAARGLIVGSLFDRDVNARGRLASLPSHVEDQIRTDGSEFLLTRFWGAYLAIWHGQDGRVHALRDPSGAMPCYLCRIERVDLLCSDIGLVADLAPTPFAIDEQFVQAFTVNNSLATSLTGLKGVLELLPGQEITWRDGKRSEPRWAWNAARICAEPHQMDFEEASSEIRRIAERCIADWGTTYRRIAVRLSGGLDSSILTGLFAQLPDVEVLPLHIVGSDYEAQELSLARLTASRAGLALSELHYDPNAVRLEGMLASPRFARPTKQVLGMHAQDIIIRELALNGADCVVAGHGGDALFLQGVLAADMLSDFVRLRGLHRDFWRVAFATAVSQERPVARILVGALQQLIRRPRRTRVARSRPSDGTQSLLVREVIEALPAAYFDNGWIAVAPSLAPGKLKQLQSVITLKDYWSERSYGGTCDELLPYLSQPIVEVALRTPTYVLGKDGTDRSLERRAFTDLIPEDVERRTGKGMINHQLLTILTNNLPFIRELLLTGCLVQQGWIIRAALERALTREHFAQGDGLEVRSTRFPWVMTQTRSHTLPRRSG